MREIIQLNNNWFYSPSYEEGMELRKLEKYELVNLPHSNIEVPYNYFDEKIYQFVSFYQLPIYVDESKKNKIIIINFEGVMTYAKVYINGQYVGEHKGGYTPFKFDITDFINFDKENILSVIVDSTEREDIPPFGGQIDYLTYGGIYREVSLEIYDKIYIENAQIKTKNIYDEKKALEVDLYINNTLKEERDVKVKLSLFNQNNEMIFEESNNISISSEKEKITLNYNNIEKVKLWDIDNPNLYKVSIDLYTNEYSDKFETKIGFRECIFKSDGFYLNNKKLKIFGLNRHQSYPYIGYAMPKRVQEKDALILKNELHVNLVRTSHYPQSKHFINKCDEIGLLVFEEIPGWQHIGNEEWKKVAIQNVKEMIERDWNHPSIVIWGVRINESQDDDSFYEQTNKIAKEIDSTRQTGGVRYIENSNLLEDVYTMNDFIFDGGDKVLRDQREVTHLDYDVPYLVTECNGHMFPTKIFDNEERQMEHVLRHIKVHNESYLKDNISGVIAWCAFDYNTHKDFGSGDRICYHGVMDMFRNKKLAGYFYQSQISPEKDIVLKPITFWARGERSIGGVIPLLIVTNCDYIELQYGNFPSKKIYPSKELFKGLKYPPILIDETIISAKDIGEWGMLWEDCTFKGYVNDKLVVETKLAKNPIPTHLRVKQDDLILNSLQKDATRITVKVTDQYDNVMPFLDDIISLDIKGVGRIIGPKNINLKGGSIAFWVETINKKGIIDVEITSQRVGSTSIQIKVE